MTFLFLSSLLSLSLSSGNIHFRITDLLSRIAIQSVNEGSIMILPINFHEPEVVVAHMAKG